jgi:hypothetical protein
MSMARTTGGVEQPHAELRPEIRDQRPDEMNDVDNRISAVDLTSGSSCGGRSSICSIT